MVQDYHYINSRTVKNSYSLLLISDLIDMVESKKVFTKLDLWWGYNNVRIKEGDEWKAAFITPMGSYKPMVMVFRLTNFPVTFQVMMNNILRELINTGEVISFIDNVLVETDMEEWHDEVIEEMLKIMEENNLYVKLEKCV